MNTETLNFRDGKSILKVVEQKGSAMGVCATFNKKYLCCNFHVLRSVQNCPYECTYCFLQNYLNDGITKTAGNINALIKKVKSNISKEPQRLFRIGTWELGDSLALESKTGQARELVNAFASFKNAVLELRTKSDCVDNIIDLDHKNRTIVSWSLNTEQVIRNEEHFTATLDSRMAAMSKISRADYLVGLHFDPIIYHEGWEKDYKELINRVFESVPADRVAWISMGSLRFNPEMKKMIENNYPDSRITSVEMVLGDDAKIRYVKPLRIKMYRFLYRELQKYLTKDNLVYLCMERWDVWDKVFGNRPESIDHLDDLFAKSLYERFGIGEGGMLSGN